MAGVETVAVDRWLYGRLTADAALTALVGSRVYGWLAPTGAAMPFVVFQMQSSRDVMGVGAARVMTDGVWVVKAVAEEGKFTGTLSEIAERLDALLHDIPGAVVAEGTVLHSVREEPFALFEINDGRQFRHLGGIYRIWAQ